jgi:hypothetical protein
MFDTGLVESAILVTVKHPSWIENGSVVLGVMMVKTEECDHSLTADVEIFATETSGKEAQEIRVFQGDIPTV